MGLTPVESSIGGILIGTSVAAMFLLHGRVAGISGTFKGVLQYFFGKSNNLHEVQWRIAFIIGLLISYPLHSMLFGPSGASSALPDINTAVVSGLLVGLGTSLANGCTSGHMICGVARLSKRSILATITFCLTAFIIINFTSQATTIPQIESVNRTDIEAYLITLAVVWSTYLILYSLRNSISPLIPYFFNGLVFGLGLITSGMANPAKVKGFFDLSNWDGSLMFVAMFAILPNLLLFNSVVKKNMERKTKPAFETSFFIPTATDITPSLIIGSILFGIGWGAAGICPGPGIVSISSLSLPILLWVFSFLVGQSIAVFVV